MKKVLTFVFLILYVSINYANDVIKLPKHFKVENTFSGDLSDTQSFHLIFSKNKENKQYTIHPYLFDGKEVTTIEPVENNKEFKVVSFHKRNNILSILCSYDIKNKSFLKRVDFNLDTKTSSLSNEFDNEDFLSSVRLKDKTILVYKTDDKFTIKEFFGNEPVNEKSYTFKEKDVIKNFLKKENVTTIKTDEFVANGSPNKVKLYYVENSLVFTKDSDEPFNIAIGGIPLNNKKTNTTQVLKIDLTTKKVEPVLTKINNGDGEKFKKATSYFLNNKLFQLALSKKKALVKITDITEDKTLNTITLDESLTPYIKGNPNFIGFEKFLKTAGKNKYNATITANSSKNGDELVVRVDYVDKDYSYNYNWWWHHQQFMMHNQMMHQMRMSVPSGFGPSQPDDFAFDFAVIKKDKRFFELVIDTNGQLLKNDLPETIYKEIDKKEYIDKLEDVKDIKHESSCFLKDEFRYIGYSRKLKAFVFQTNKIK